MLTKKNIKYLSKIKSDPAVSLFIPTYRAGSVQEDKIRFKNALKTAGQKLQKQDMTQAQVRDFLSGAYELLEEEKFWRYMSDGLAVFIGRDIFEKYVLPVNFNEYVHVGTSFYLRPVLNVFNDDVRFFLLAFSQRKIRFFECSRYSITPVEIKDLVPQEEPAEALMFAEPEEALQHHSGQGPGYRGIFHGQGGGEEENKKHLKEYLRLIDKGLMEMLHDETDPLVLACVDPVAPLYREVSAYKNILKENISGNPDGLDPVALHQKAWAIVKDRFVKDKEARKKEFMDYMARDLASFSLNDIIPKAKSGMIEKLYIDKNYHAWGNFNENDFKIHIHEQPQANSEELLNLAALEVFMQGGVVYNVPRDNMPQPTSNLNAIYRY